MQYADDFSYYQPKEDESRIIGPALPFVGGALLGYLAGRPGIGYGRPYGYPIYPSYYQVPAFYTTYYGYGGYSPYMPRRPYYPGRY